MDYLYLILLCAGVLIIGAGVKKLSDMYDGYMMRKRWRK